MSDEKGLQPKIGAGHAQAMFRAGLKELGQALVALPDSNVRPVEEPGLAGNPTPQIVTQEMGAQNTYQDMLRSYAARAADDRENQQGLER